MVQFKTNAWLTCSVTKALIWHTQAPDEFQCHTLEQLCLKSGEDVNIMKEWMWMLAYVNQVVVQGSLSGKHQLVYFLMSLH
jgi:hypothetical protein